MEITIGLALIAGLVSFISPCVLPLVPAYIGYMGGRLTHQVA
ncbi:MAG: cytochrome c biogenesis protein CcdA, partial [Chloroflexota bacterium]|nr:cytochrome c biogenesis protein CcdA [Chloroflexota bacterium]